MDGIKAIIQSEIKPRFAGALLFVDSLYLYCEEAL